MGRLGGNRTDCRVMKEIVAAIDEGAAFVFVMTPDSMASTICLQELAHAAGQNKRLIPIVRRDVEASSTPDSLAKLNWIFFRETDDFPKALQTLVTAIDTDQGWVKAHTRLLVRAREWDAKGREASLALRGKVCLPKTSSMRKALSRSVLHG